MENYNDLFTQLKKELEVLPREYTQTIATRNRDVVYYMVRNFNIGRFLIFMDNYYNGIPDKITIAKFGVDGPTTTEILYYDGNIITYVVDGTRFQTNQFYYYLGDKIIVDKRDLHYDEVMIDYNLITLEGMEVPIIGIWAGF
jgi:hypothetical protein